MRFGDLLAASLLIGASGCVKPAAEGPARVAGAADAIGCAAASFPDDRYVTAAFTDRFNGRYWLGARSIDVWREGQRLFAGTRGGEARQLQRSSADPGSGAFRDGCGRSYQFTLPPDGPGGYVVVADPVLGTSRWHRR